MAYTFNGIGTMFYGECDFRPDGTFITTEWLVLFWIPLFPVRSLRVRLQGETDTRGIFGSGITENYMAYGKCRLHLHQALRTQGFFAFMAAWIYSIGWLFPQAFEHGLTLGILVIAWAIPVPAPWVMRRLAKRKLRLREIALLWQNRE